MCYTWLAENTGRKNYAKNRHLRPRRTTLSGYIFATKAHIDNRKKSWLNSNISSTCLYNKVKFGRLAAEIYWRVWGAPANFNRFRVLASLGLLHRRRSTKVNHTLHSVWPSPALVHYVYIFEGSCHLPPNGILLAVKFTLRPILAFSYIGSVKAKFHYAMQLANQLASWFASCIA